MDKLYINVLKSDGNTGIYFIERACDMILISTFLIDLGTYCIQTFIIILGFTSEV